LRIGLTGDTHNNSKNINTICEIFNDEKVDLVIHTGDISLPKSLDLFKSLNCKLIGVFGNNDQGDLEDLLKVCDLNGFDFQNGYRKLEFKGRSIFIIHDPKDIKDEFYGNGNIIVHGHTHRFRDEIIQGTFFFNPGECAGIMKGRNQIGIIYLESPRMRILNF